MNDTLKNIIVVIVIIAFVAFAYMYFVNGSASEEGSFTDVSPDEGQQSAVQVSNIVFLLGELKEFSIDTDFVNRELDELKDFRTVLPQEPKGKANPFLKIPGVSDAQ